MIAKRLLIVAATLALASIAGTAAAHPPRGPAACATGAFTLLMGADAGTCQR
ncbi:MAG: hypothetical protein JWM27_263 [Gemmatimonadetes bacterium]|nr:hypothetical protein [Gemmatimonadota bacterium]